MIITELLEKNAKFYPNEVSLVEINPANRPAATVTWKEFSLIESAPGRKYRRELTWREFDVRANRFANLLLTRGVKKGDKVITAGGIYGVVKEVHDTSLLIEVDSNVTLRIDKNMVVGDPATGVRQ